MNVLSIVVICNGAERSEGSHDKLTFGKLRYRLAITERLKLHLLPSTIQNKDFPWSLPLKLIYIQPVTEPVEGTV